MKIFKDFLFTRVSIKLIQIPKVSNSNRSDLAIEFVSGTIYRMKTKKITIR